MRIYCPNEIATAGAGAGKNEVQRIELDMCFGGDGGEGLSHWNPISALICARRIGFPSA